jgi:hypothetical protein
MPVQFQKVRIPHASGAKATCHSFPAMLFPVDSWADSYDGLLSLLDRYSGVLMASLSLTSYQSGKPCRNRRVQGKWLNMPKSNGATVRFRAPFTACKTPVSPNL